MHVMFFFFFFHTYSVCSQTGMSRMKATRVSSLKRWNLGHASQRIWWFTGRLGFRTGYMPGKRPDDAVTERGGLLRANAPGQHVVADDATWTAHIPGLSFKHPSRPFNTLSATPGINKSAPAKATVAFFLRVGLCRAAGPCSLIGRNRVVLPVPGSVKP